MWTDPKILEWAIGALNTAAFVYLAASFAFVFTIATLGSKQEKLWKGLGSICVVLGFALHTSGLLMRWYLGGIGHPPWTNLYESLVFFAWGVSLLQVVALRKWKLVIVGVVASPLIFVLMGMSVMTPNKLVEPLIPALQSNWLKIHVVFGMLSYAGFTTAACLAFLHLMRNGVSLSKIGAGLSLVALIHLGVAGGRDFFKTGSLYMARTVTQKMEDGRELQVKDVYREYEGGPMITRMEEVPHGGPLLWGSLIGFAAAAFLMTKKAKKSKRLVHASAPSAAEAAKHGYDWSRGGVTAFSIGVGFLMARFGAVALAIKQSENLTMYSNSYLMFLLAMTLFFCGLYLVIGSRYKKFLASLPSAARLDELSYKNVLFAFPFQTLLLVTGAIWAYYAWGRSWGWDPKETWAFITWVAFLIYLHGKMLMKWKPNLLSVVAIAGFIILIFAFLGVNLVLSGLHSYGAA